MSLLLAWALVVHYEEAGWPELDCPADTHDVDDEIDEGVSHG